MRKKAEIIQARLSGRRGGLPFEESALPDPRTGIFVFEVRVEAYCAETKKKVIKVLSRVGRTRNGPKAETAEVAREIALPGLKSVFLVHWLPSEDAQIIEARAHRVLAPFRFSNSLGLSELFELPPQTACKVVMKCAAP